MNNHGLTETVEQSLCWCDMDPSISTNSRWTASIDSVILSNRVYPNTIWSKGTDCWRCTTSPSFATFRASPTASLCDCHSHQSTSSNAEGIEIAAKNLAARLYRNRWLFLLTNLDISGYQLNSFNDFEKMNDNGTRMVCLWLCCWKYIAKIRPNSQGNCSRFWSWSLSILGSKRRSCPWRHKCPSSTSMGKSSQKSQQKAKNKHQSAKISSRPIPLQQLKTVWWYVLQIISNHIEPTGDPHSLAHNSSTYFSDHPLQYQFCSPSLPMAAPDDYRQGGTGVKSPLGSAKTVGAIQDAAGWAASGWAWSPGIMGKAWYSTYTGIYYTVYQSKTLFLVSLHRLCRLIWLYLGLRSTHRTV